MIVGDLLLAATIYVISHLLPVYKFRMQKASKYLAKEYLLMLIVFSSLNIAYSSGLEFHYGSSHNLFMTVNQMAAIACSLLPIVVSLVYLYAERQHFGSFSTEFNS